MVAGAGSGPALRAVLLDCDGVLTDSEPLHYEAFRRVLDTEGIHLTEEDYFGHAFRFASTDAAMIRMALESRWGQADTAVVDSLVSAKVEIVDSGVDDLPLIEPTIGFARRCRERGLRLAVCSGERAGFVRAILQRAGLDDEVEAVVGCDDVEDEKPEPGPYLATLRALQLRGGGLTPEGCLVVEDSPVGCASGRAAGMWVVGLTTSNPGGALADAHIVLPHLSGIDPAALEARLSELVA